MSIDLDKTVRKCLMDNFYREFRFNLLYPEFQKTTEKIVANDKEEAEVFLEWLVDRKIKEEE